MREFGATEEVLLAPVSSHRHGAFVDAGFRFAAPFIQASFLLLVHRLQVLDEDDFSEEVGSGSF